MKMQHQSAFIILWIIFAGCQTMLAQQGQICSGGDHSGSGGSVAFSIGQPVYSFYSGTYGRIAEGVQQPDDCPGIIASETSGCSGAVLDQMTIDVAGGSWSALSAVGTSVSQSGVVTLGTNTGTAQIQDTIVFALNSCTDSVFVTIYPTPSITSPVSTSGCSGTALPTMSADIAGGSWSILSGIGSTVNGSGVVTLGTPVGVVSDMDSVVYTVNGCADTVSVTAYPYPDITATDTSACSGLTLSPMSANVAGGVWSVLSDIGTMVNQSGTVTLGNNGGAGTNQDTVYYTADGCADSIVVAIVLQAEISATDTTGCGGALLAPLTALPAGGTWSTLSKHGTAVNQSGVVTLGTNSGAVAVSDTVIYASNGCRDSITVTIQPAINITATDTSGCSGEALPPLSASVPGGQWSVLSGIGTLISNTGTVTLGSNTSAVVDTDSILYTANSCTDTILVVVYALPAAALADTVFCAADTLRFQENGGAAISWSWSGPGGFTASTQLPVASPAIAGTYTVTVTDANGCSSTDSLQVKPLPLVNALNGGPYCPGAIGNLYEKGGQGVEWFWQFPSGFASGLKNPKISPAVGGDYIVTVRGTNGCYASDTTTLCVSAPEAVCLPQVQLGLGANSEATLTPAMVDGGSLAGTCIGLSTMTVDQDLFSCTAVGTQQVTLTVTDSAGCQSMCQSEVIVIESGAANAGSCPCEGDTLYLDGTLVSDAHKAADYIESGGSLIVGASVIMQAGQQIRLLPGFVAPSGTSFTARIDTCAGVVPPASSPPPYEGAVARQSWQADTTLLHAGTGDLTTKVWPNPFIESFTLEGTVSHATKVSVWMQSIQGGVVRVLLEDAPVSSGTFRYKLSQSTSIPAGVYVLTIRTTSGQNTHRVIRMR